MRRPAIVLAAIAVAAWLQQRPDASRHADSQAPQTQSQGSQTQSQPRNLPQSHDPAASRNAAHSQNQTASRSQAEQRSAPARVPGVRTGVGSIDAAVAQHLHGVRVQGEGRVVRLLSDDTEGSPHQRFLLRLDSGTTVLVAHNTELAPRLDALQVGDTVEFSGEYLWNPKGGVVHWTHHDPSGQHAAGWLRHAGQVSQ